MGRVRSLVENSINFFFAPFPLQGLTELNKAKHGLPELNKAKQGLTELNKARWAPVWLDECKADDIISQPPNTS